MICKKSIIKIKTIIKIYRKIGLCTTDSVNWELLTKEWDCRNTSAICCWIEELTETNKPINTLKKWKVFWNKELHAVFAGEKIAPQVYPRRLGQSSRSYLSRVPLAIEALWQNIDLVTNCAGLNSVNHKKNGYH